MFQLRKAYIGSVRDCHFNIVLGFKTMFLCEGYVNETSQQNRKLRFI